MKTSDSASVTHTNNATFAAVPICPWCGRMATSGPIAVNPDQPHHLCVMITDHAMLCAWCSKPITITRRVRVDYQCSRRS